MSANRSWRPAAIEEVEHIVQTDLLSCNSAEKEAFRRFAVEAYEAPLVRHGQLELVVVVARRGNAVIYWEDVEEGFNLSPISSEGSILEHSCSQDDLRLAIRRWL
jgi:hypothetical protein